MDEEAYKITEEDITWMEGMLEGAHVENVSRDLAVKILKASGGKVRLIAQMMKPEQMAQLYQELNDKELGRQ